MKSLMLLAAVCVTALLMTSGCATHKSDMACNGDCCKDPATCAKCCTDAAGCAKCCHKT